MVSLGIPDTDLVNRSILWVMYVVAGLFFVTLLAFAIINGNDGAAEEDALAVAVDALG